MGQPWFKPKRVGYGATPTTWQGWLAIAVFVALMTSNVVLLRGVLRWACGAALVAAFIGFVHAKSSGVWRWRSGKP